jgi:hypothetical protein
MFEPSLGGLHVVLSLQGCWVLPYGMGYIPLWKKLCCKAMVGRCQEVVLASKHEVGMCYTCFYHQIACMGMLAGRVTSVSLYGLALVHTLG